MTKDPRVAQIEKTERQIREAKKLLGVKTERDASADRMRKKREADRIVIIPPCADRPRRERLEQDDIAWLMFYFSLSSGSAAPFTYEFTAQQRDMIEAIRRAITEGGDQALAASRGEGKTSLFERLLLKYTLQGVIKFSVLFQATGSAAEDSLEAIKGEVEDNDHLLADYPEVCVPVRALEHVHSRAHYARFSGVRHDNGQAFEAAAGKFTWCGQEIILPKVPGAPASGAIIATRGLDAAVRGVKKKGRRVDVAGIDDPDTEETARSEEQAAKLEKRIDRAIAGLGNQQRPVARVMLTTLQNRAPCVSARFTDPTIKPSWNGKRFRFMVTAPKRLDLWEQYISLRQGDWQNETTHAHEFYVANRADMELGAEVANPNRYATGELSAIQHYYNLVARYGQEAVSTEYDNDPPEESGPMESGINAMLVRQQVSGFSQGEIPPDCTVLAHGVDVGKYWLHWVVRAFRPNGTGFTIDYGRQPVYDTKHGSDEGLDRAIHAAILQRVADFRDTEYFKAMREPLTLVDCGFRTDAVYAACVAAGLGVMPIKGIGQSAGVAQQGRFNDVVRATMDKQPVCDGVFFSMHRTPNIQPFALVCASADQWKAWEHDRWLTARDKPGCMYLWGQPDDDPRRLSPDQQQHGHYAHQICAEVEVEEVHKGALRRRWKNNSKENHWLDASYYADVAAAIKGVRVVSEPIILREPARRRAVISAGASRPDGRSFV